MPLVHKEKKVLALQLRSEGKSYREIQKATGLPSRSTLAIWFKDLKLSPEAAKILQAKKEQAEKNILKWSKERSVAVKKRNAQTLEQHTATIGKLSKRDLTLIGAALYWGEGSLRMSKGPYPDHYKTEFSNSSPDTVKVFMKFSREVLGVTTEEFRPHVQIYPNLDAQKSINFWSRITKIPASYFRAYTQVSRASKHKRPINFLPYGTVQIRMNNPVNFYKIRGYIDGIIKGIET